MPERNLSRHGVVGVFEIDACALGDCSIARIASSFPMKHLLSWSCGDNDDQ